MNSQVGSADNHRSGPTDGFGLRSAMRIAFATIYDATSLRSGFSSYNGVGYHMGRSLAGAGASVDYLGPLREPFFPFTYAKQRLIRKLVGRGYNRHREIFACRSYSRQIERKLAARADCDVLLSGLSVGSQPIAYVETKLPIVIWTDSTLSSAVGFYPDLCPAKTYWPNLMSGLRNEREAYSRAAMAIFSSEWARHDAIRQYALDPARVKVVPFGPNLEPASREAVHASIESRQQPSPDRVCRLLFVGMEWHRKGGDIAVEVASIMHRRGIPVELTLVGRPPPSDHQLPRFVQMMGLLTRQTAGAPELLSRLYARSHFLVLPSRADASPHVLIEANAFGVPCATSNVGGIPSIIRDGVNGRIFPGGADPAAYAEWLCTVFSDAAAYTRLAQSCFSEYESRLNWPAAGRAVFSLVDALIHPQHRRLRPVAAAA